MAKNKARSRTKWGRVRFWVQTGFVLVWLFPLIRLHTICSPVFHCYSCPLAAFACPIGILANFSAYHLMPYMALGTLFAVGAVTGSAVCGWACPFGFLQDLAAKVPTPKVTLPSWTGWFRYAVLGGLVLAIPYFFGEDHPLFFCRVCPAGALEAAVPFTVQQAMAGSEVIPWPSTPKLIVLGLFLAAIFFAWRPWCTVFCPLGAIFALCNKFSFFFLRFHADRCRDCAVCRSLCRDGSRTDARVDSLRCVRCMECKNCQAVTLDTVVNGPAPPQERTLPISER